MSDYKVDLNLNLLQNIRCVQALMEEYKICVNSEYLYIFDYLNKVFNTTI